MVRFLAGAPRDDPHKVTSEMTRDGYFGRWERCLRMRFAQFRHTDIVKGAVL